MRHVINQFRSQENGAVLVLFALILTPTLFLLVMTVELSRQNYYETKISYAIDAATLAAGRYDVEDIQVNGQKFFYANFNSSDSNVSVSTPLFTLSSDGKYVNSSVSGKMTTLIGSFMGIGTLKIAGITQVQRAIQKAEIALVLDNTGSMGSNGKMQALITASNQLITNIFGNQATLPNVAMSIVPYVATVNIGPSNVGWVSNSSILSDTSKFPSDAQWKGCVYAIDTKTTMDTDDPPSSTRKWPIYQVPSTYGLFSFLIPGDNDWIVLNKKLIVMNPSVPTVGPNRSCGLPIVGLTNVKSTLTSTINAMAAVDGGGTFGNLGLVWGWNTLSPKWTGLWNSPVQPAPYGNVIKSIVIVTDGENSWYNDTAYVPTGDPTAYGRVTDGLLGTTDITKTRAQIDKRLLDLCTKIKNHGIQIFTVTFQVSDSLAKQNYLQCATKPEWAFQANSAADLSTHFNNIGDLLKSVTVTK